MDAEQHRDCSYRNYSNYWGTPNIGAGPDFRNFWASEKHPNIGALSEIVTLDIGAEHFFAPPCDLQRVTSERS